MSDSGNPIPCTKPKVGSYAPHLLHFSIALRPARGAGRTGMALCGLAGVVDQDRLNLRPGPRIRLHELRICRACRRSLTLLGLLHAARAAHSVLVNT